MGNTTAPLKDELPCGCVRGYRLCAAAEALWRGELEAYRAGDDERGDELRAQYEAHFEVIEVPHG